MTPELEHYSHIIRTDFYNYNQTIAEIEENVTFTAESTTAQFACCKRGVTLSTMFSASRASAALYLERASSIKT